MNRLLLRGDTAANWTSANSILLARELGIETDTRKIKIGNGATVWTSLPYSSAPVLTGATSAIGGSALTVGQRATGTVSVTGATTGMAVACSPVSDPGAGFVWHAYVSSAGTVTVWVTCIAIGTPSAVVYNVRVLV